MFRLEEVRVMKKLHGQRRAQDSQKSRKRYVLRTGDGTGETTTYKSTHSVLLEDKREAENEIRELEARLAVLRTNAGLPTAQDTRAVNDTLVSNVAMEKILWSSVLRLDGIFTRASLELHNPRVNPLKTFIHLPRDHEERRRTLRAMQNLKLTRAAEVGLNLMYFIDHTRPYLSETRFTTEDGRYHYHRHEIRQFPNFDSPHQLYDTLLYYLNHTEMVIAETLGQVAIREDTGDIAPSLMNPTVVELPTDGSAKEADPVIWQHRIVTENELIGGVVEELNSIGFAQFLPSYEPMGQGPIGIVATDSVDVDELYPYRPSERTAKSTQKAYISREVWSPDGSERVVVLVLCSLSAQLPPAFPIQQIVMNKVYEYMPRWPEAMLKYLKDFKPPKAPIHG